MKVRHVLVIITSIIILVSIVLAFMMGYNAGMSKGEQDAEKIRAKRLADAMANDTTIKDTNFVKVFAAPFTNQIKPITAAGFGQVVSSSMINITSEVQGVINAGIELKKTSISFHRRISNMFDYSTQYCRMQYSLVD